jgi:hypothetical protein
MTTVAALAALAVITAIFVASVIADLDVGHGAGPEAPPLLLHVA